MKTAIGTWIFKHGECDSSNEGQNVKSIGNKQKHGRMDDLLDNFSKKAFWTPSADKHLSFMEKGNAMEFLWGCLPVSLGCYLSFWDQ